MARVEMAMGRSREARRRADSLLFAETLRGPGLLAAQFLDQFPDLSVAELIAMARAHRARGARATTESYLRRAVARSDTSAAARLALARHLAEGGRAAEALRLVDSAGAIAGPRRAAQIVAARIEVLALLGRYDEAAELASAASRAHPRDTTLARAVLFLADRDRARGEPAREWGHYRLLVRRFPAAPATLVARLRIGLGLYARGALDSAALVFEDVSRRDSTRRLGLSAWYWDARVRLELGDTTATSQLMRLASQFPLNYYGVRALELLGRELRTTDSLLARPQAGSFAPAVARERVRALVRLGLREEVRSELLGWATDSSVGAHLLLAVAAVAAEAGFAREAIALGEAVRSRVGPHPQALRAIFPYPHRTVIEAEAIEHCVDPLLFAALLRQESRFEPHAVSPVGARGLSQVMPQTGQELARAMGIRDFDPDLLFVPDYNLHFGTRYFHERLVRDNFPLHAAIASYNAGPNRVRRWRAWPEFEDPDLFSERIPIAETREYVRIVYASYAWYRHLYSAAPPLVSSPVPLP
ncbi:MAG TPA: lytic transglycosylase domain-containing protein, partial [Gemmatimonadales bacterium]|nr:lytic transglycosylase domain-containing protein [Gemmatimonadales bacterium]